MQLNQKLINDGKYLFKYRGQIPLILCLLSIPIIFETSYHNIYTTNFKSILQTLAVCISILGLLLRYYTIGSTPDQTSGRNRNKQIAEYLNTTGSYSVIRHPLYTGNYLIWLGLSLFSLSYIFMIMTTLLFIIHYERIILVEEDFLLKKFKTQYTLFCNKVPLCLPNFKHFKKPKQQFSIKKILRQEYSSTLSVIISFIYLDIVTRSIYSYLYLDCLYMINVKYHIWILFLSIYITICLKIFKQYTNLLND